MNIPVSNEQTMHFPMY